MFFMLQGKEQVANTVLKVLLNMLVIKSLLEENICQGAGSYTNKISILHF